MTTTSPNLSEVSPSPEDSPPTFRPAWYGRRWFSWLLVAAAIGLILYGLLGQSIRVYRRPPQSPETAQLKSAFSYSGATWVGQATFHGVERRKDGQLVSTWVWDTERGPNAPAQPKAAPKQTCPT